MILSVFFPLLRLFFDFIKKFYAKTWLQSFNPFWVYLPSFIVT